VTAHEESLYNEGFACDSEKSAIVRKRILKHKV